MDLGISNAHVCRCEARTARIAHSAQGFTGTPLREREGEREEVRCVSGFRDLILTFPSQERCTHAQVAFYDTTPVGRILNRFSKDMDNVDTMISFQFQQYFRTGIQVRFLWLLCLV